MTGPEHAAIVVERTVEWADTDASGMIHNTLANRLLESAEAELLRRLGLADLIPVMPRVRLLFEFRERLCFGQALLVELRVRELGRTSLTWEMAVRDPRGAVAMTGEAVVVHTPAGAAEPWPGPARALLLSGGCR